MKRWPTWALMAAIVIALLVVGGTRARGESSSAGRVRAIAETVKCPVCAGESVYESRVPVAGLIRDEIARQVAGGHSDREVRAAVQRAYPDAQILTPPATGVGAIVWMLPVMLFVLGGFGLARAFLRWRVP